VAAWAAQLWIIKIAGYRAVTVHVALELPHWPEFVLITATFRLEYVVQFDGGNVFSKRMDLAAVPGDAAVSFQLT
jgi:hypothetical protein